MEYLKNKYNQETIASQMPAPFICDFDINFGCRIFKLYPFKNFDLSLVVKQFFSNPKFDSLSEGQYSILAHVKVIGVDIERDQELIVGETGEKLKVMAILLQMGKDLIEVTRAYKGSIVCKSFLRLFF